MGARKIAGCKFGGDGNSRAVNQMKLPHFVDIPDWQFATWWPNAVDNSSTKTLRLNFPATFQNGPRMQCLHTCVVTSTSIGKSHSLRSHALESCWNLKPSSSHSIFQVWEGKLDPPSLLVADIFKSLEQSYNLHLVEIILSSSTVMWKTYYHVPKNLTDN